MANNIIKRIWNQNTLVNIEALKGAIFQDEDNGHTFEISGVDNSGNAISLSGTVAGVFLRPDNTDVPITGSASGGVISVTLPAECYDVPGRFGLTVFVTADGQKTCVYAAIGTVGRTSSGSVAPGTSADVVDLINQISAAVATIPASWSGLMADIAPTYSASAAYPVGAYVYYNGDLYRCTTAITTGETWTAAHWTTAVLGNDVSDLKNAIEETNDSLMLVSMSEAGDMRPFYRIDAKMDKRQKVFKNDGTSSYANGFTTIMKCPKILSWNIPNGTSRMYLYVGDMVNGEFVLDTNFILNTTSGGVYNYLNEGHTATIETDGTKYFYYSKVNDQGIEIIGADNFHEINISEYTFSPWWAGSDGRALKDERYNSIFFPAGSFFVLNYGIDANIGLSTPEKSEDFRYVWYGNKRFGFIPSDAGYGILRFRNSTDLTKIKLFCSEINKNRNRVVGRNRAMEKNIYDAICNFVWTSKVGIPWSDSSNTLTVGKDFYGVPYSSRWSDAHWIGIEVSIETALNAANDEYSIFYDLTAGRTAIGERGGPGYGLVCSTCICMSLNLPYPQSIQGMTYDSNFAFTPVSSFQKGDIAIEPTHICYVHNVLENGYTIFEEYQPCVGVTTHTGLQDYRMGKYTTGNDYLDNYDYAVSLMRGADSEKLYKDYTENTIVGGSVRPWRGNKSVYSNVDPSVFVTIHGNVNTIYLVKPNESVVSIDVNSGDTVVDIASYIDADGVYALYSDLSNTKEFFKYISHSPVTLTINSDGSVVFSDNDIEYAYIGAVDFGDNAPKWGERLEGPMVVHKDSRYPGLREKVTEVINAMAYDEWGRYPVSCSMTN